VRGLDPDETAVLLELLGRDKPSDRPGPHRNPGPLTAARAAIRSLGLRWKTAGGRDTMYYARVEDEPEELYEGIPVGRLLVNEVDWVHRGEHIRTRTVRYADRPDEFDVEPEWATEAALDPRSARATTGGKSLEIIGWSISAPPRQKGEGGRLLKVWVVPKHLSNGSWWGASACDASESDRKSYGEAK
jgi:hypothetical protein